MIKHKNGEDLILSCRHGTKESGIWVYPDGCYSFYMLVGAGYGELICNARKNARHIPICRDVLAEITMAHNGGGDAVAFMAKSKLVRRLK